MYDRCLEPGAMIVCVSPTAVKPHTQSHDVIGTWSLNVKQDCVATIVGVCFLIHIVNLPLRC